MNRFRASILAGAMISMVMIVAACTTTSYQQNPSADLNSACALGFNNDRPCSY
ncbi:MULTISPECIES: hypothetical protein [Rhizobium]|uniref:hypothetical protein n=1 Tax=Rhizobium TaxID=379 RepID=UPI0018854881|nr:MULTISPECIES: hypothetical protein [Rhizobium]